ncbi:NAD-dependent epimerase/dehydratase family protein [Flagellimonas pacifica]|uniref:UDP-glucuronate 4-epimerase n=1 Tax=Flagellimonas pacifica TaxID=1247520 RepID=A0A285MR62_9FLAO|nr:NAD-dependent epimerase/dehydratase family protein [Allomuricauda parva]SNY99645.1 UDP-glucuronate 4-epimerase [Allomuricauda parva]
MNILVTGAAGFIGYHLSKKLLDNGHNVIGLDNINDYYDVNLKFARLEQLGIQRNIVKTFGNIALSDIYPSFKFIRLTLENKEELNALFEKEQITIVCNLAAQAGVRYSLENPETYINSNIVGFLNILECCRNHSVKHLVYASSSSVYGLNKETPFKVCHTVDSPISLYAASKKSNELMAHTYSHLFGFRTTGLRFFTVYGPWGRPDMAMFLFTKAILNKNSISVFNNGDLERDFTYVDDIINGIVPILEDKYTSSYNPEQLYNLYNIGNSKSVKLLSFIEEIEKTIGIKATKVMKPMQPGDVKATWADVSDLERDYNYRPNTPIKIGIKQFVDWYRAYYNI